MAEVPWVTEVLAAQERTAPRSTTTTGRPATMTLRWQPDAGCVQLSVFDVVLSREQMNALIRQLRRARDAAYGGDQ